MKKLKFLKLIVDFVFLFSIVSSILTLFLLGFVLFDFNFATFIDIKLKGIEFSELSKSMKLMLVLYSFVCELVIIYGLYLFKSIIKLFLNNRVFRKEVIDKFLRIGNLMITFAIVSFIAKTLFFAFNRKIDSTSFTTNLLVLGFGFFFIVLIEIINTSKEMKIENELTI